MIFYTYIRTERIRISVIIVVILNEFSYGRDILSLFVANRCLRAVSWTLYFSTQPRAKTESLGLNLSISFLQLYKHINIYVNNTSYGVRTEAKSL